MQASSVLLLLVSTASVVLAASNDSDAHNFLLILASGGSPDSSATLSAVDHTLKEINMVFPFQLKYNASDNQVRNTYRHIMKLNIEKYYFSIVQCDKST